MFVLRKRKGTAEEKTGVMERFADSFESSKEIFLDIPRIICLGNRELTVENYLGICEYTENRIVLAAKPQFIKIEGKGLEVRTVSRDMVYVTGEICGFEFKRER